MIRVPIIDDDDIEDDEEFFVSLTEPEVAVEEVAVSQLARGDVIKVLPGSQVPLDGKVLDGCSTVNQAMLTGEALPVRKAAGDLVVGGTINGGGVLWVGVTASAADSTLAQIAAVVADAQHRKPSVQVLADRIARRFVPAILIIALATWATWTVITAFGGVTQTRSRCRSPSAHVSRRLYADRACSVEWLCSHCTSPGSSRISRCIEGSAHRASSASRAAVCVAVRRGTRQAPDEPPSEDASPAKRACAEAMKFRS